MKQEPFLKLITKNIPSVGTFGELFVGGFKQAVSVEREWQDNEKNISCVPAGRYKLIPHYSEKFGHVYALDNEALGVTPFGPSQRTLIYIHSANFPHELQGCIAFGETYHPFEWGVSDSKLATNKIYDLIKEQNIDEIEIIRY
ncbi:hypothetical protein JCM19232_2629 [Vibrio ishigakensis]|uniref:DUF5675 domain-containing protein n=1 Tax=Vibrio ishigakensis TaxID=1481914 RepID=A0A0B8PLR5_9VIBR|nr:hypothetical protein JCM19232_2629 [Vibrio ishigakensis]